MMIWEYQYEQQIQQMWMGQNDHSLNWNGCLDAKIVYILMITNADLYEYHWIG